MGGPANSSPIVSEGRLRAVIEAVSPEIDAGRFAIKRVVGEWVRVEADVFADGHDLVAGALLYRAPGDPNWREKRLEPLANDRWSAEFQVDRCGDYYYTIEAWVDHFLSWQRDLRKRIEAGADSHVDYQIGARWIAAAARWARGMTGSASMHSRG